MKRPNMRKHYPRLTLRSLLVIRIGLIIGLSLFCAACRSPRVVVIPADRQVQRMEAERVYLFPISGWFVPDARMQEIMFHMEGLLDAEETETHSNP